MSTGRSFSRAARARFARGSLLALLLLTLFVSTSTPTSANSGRVLLGVYYGNQGWNMAQVRDLEAWQRKGNAVVNLFTNWCPGATEMNNLFAIQLPNVWNNRNVPMITWEPFLCSPGQTPLDVEARAAAGEYDSYLIAWSGRLKTFLSGPDMVLGTADDRRVYLRLAHEMNGNWYPWSAQGERLPADYVAMWQRTWQIIASQGMGPQHVQWVWSVNHEDVGAFPAEAYYPGDAYVDWVAMDGYNWGTSQTWSTWRAPESLYGTMLARLRALTNKPLALTELGSSTATAKGASVADKTRWITDAFTYVVANDIRMVIWFNEDKETDWAIFGGSRGDARHKGARVYSAYQTAVQNTAFLPSDTRNPRLLTDAQFMGQ
jgi:mannan endo-1,4-beta-mannosidase